MEGSCGAYIDVILSEQGDISGQHSIHPGDLGREPLRALDHTAAVPP